MEKNSRILPKDYERAMDTDDVCGKFTEENNWANEETTSHQKLQDIKNGPQDRYIAIKSCLRVHLFILVTLMGIVLGFVLGLAVRETRPCPDALLWLGLPGEVYLRMLRALVLPLIVCSVITGTANTDTKSSGRISVVTFLYIASTNALGGVLGVALYYIASPDPGLSSNSGESMDTRNLQTVDIFADFIRNIFTDNIFGATLQQAQTKYVPEKTVLEVNISGQLVNVTKDTLKRTSGVVNSTNLIGLVVVCSVLGIAASQVGQVAKPFIAFLHSAYVIIFRVFDWIKWTTPIGVASLVANTLAQIDDLESAFTLIGIFIATVCVGNLVYQFILLPLLHLVLTQRSPMSFLIHCPKPWLLAFGTGSVAVALPEMLEICERDLKISPRVFGFVLPAAVTLNKDGSALFISATCLFITAYSGQAVTAGLAVTVAVLSTCSSFAIPSVPSSSIVCILIILSSLGVPPANIGFILAAEFVTDRIRTSANLIGVMNAVSVVWHRCRHTLKQSNDQDVDTPCKEDQIL